MAFYLAAAASGSTPGPTHPIPIRFGIDESAVKFHWSSGYSCGVTRGACVDRGGCATIAECKSLLEIPWNP
jgi:hypothetical protein